jgi:hypothetical protein
VTSYHLNSWGAHHPDPRHLVGPAAFPPSVGLTLTSLDPCALYPATVVASIFPLPSPLLLLRHSQFPAFQLCSLHLASCDLYPATVVASLFPLPSPLLLLRHSRFTAQLCTLHLATCALRLFLLPSSRSHLVAPCPMRCAITRFHVF